MIGKLGGVIIKTLDRNKSEELFNRIGSASIMLNHLKATVQNPDFVNEENVYENYCFFRENYLHLVAELSKINGSIATLHREIDNDETHNYGMVR